MTDNRLRVAHLITQLELGGAQRNTLYTVSHLDKTLFEPCLMYGPGGILDSEAQASGVPCFVIRPLVRPVRPLRDLYAAILLYKHLRYIQADIVHTHSSKAGILGRIAAYLAGIPVIVHTFHGFGFTPQQPRWIYRLFVWIETFCALLSTHLVFVSEENQRTAEALGIGRGKSSSLIRSGIAIQPDGPSTPSFSGEEKRQSSRAIQDKLNIPENAWVITYAGNFKPQKNTHDLIKVAEQVVLQTPNTHFILAGDGEDREAIQRYITEHKLEHRVHLLGWLKRRDDVQEILQFSHCFVLTSLWEGLPRALVEAFAARLPAVAYAVNGVTDILKEGETGFPIPAGDIDQAAEKLLWLQANPDKAREMGERGRRLVEKEFDIDRMVRQQEDLYSRLYEAVPLRSITARMRKVLKILLIGIAVLAILGLAATAALRFLFPSAKLRQLVEDQIRIQLNRQARLGAVHLGLRGLTLQRFTLSEVPAFSAGTFLEVDQARISWSLLPFRPRKVSLHIREGVVHTGPRTSRLASVLSNIDLAVWDFDSSRAQGRLSVDQLRSPVYTAKNFAVDWNLRDIDSSLTRLNGWMRLKQGPGLVQNIDKLAASAPSARVALMPLIMLQNLERTGMVRLGLPNLSHLPINQITGDYSFTQGVMQINTFDITGPELSMVALGSINLANGKLAVNVALKTPRPTLMGATELKMSVGGTLSNPKTNLDSLKKQAFKATVNEVLKNPEALKSIDKTLKNLFR